MTISDIDRAKAYLERIGYYRLSGYWYPFRESQRANVGGSVDTVVGDRFKPNTEFGLIVDLYVFDKKLRLLMLDAIERIEIALRVQISLQLAQRDPWAHRNPSFLHGNFSRRRDPSTGKIKHEEWLRRLDDAFDRSKEEFVKHFKQKYPGEKPPVWIAAELWDLACFPSCFPA